MLAELGIDGPQDRPGFSVEATDLSLRTKEGPVFSNVSFSCEPGQLVCLAGAAGTGRTSLSLILSGRMKFSSGTLVVGGKSIPGDRRWLRRNSAIAPTGDFAGLEEALKVREEAKRTLWLAGHTARVDAATIIETAGLTGRERTLVRELSAIERRRLDISCAFADTVGLVVIDDVCTGIPIRFQTEIWQLVFDCARNAATTVVATTLEPEPATGFADHIISLDPVDQPVSPDATDEQAAV